VPTYTVSAWEDCDQGLVVAARSEVGFYISFRTGNIREDQIKGVSSFVRALVFWAD
jgi:hypothetical protein